jgi:hypothetical protein
MSSRSCAAASSSRIQSSAAVRVRAPLRRPVRAGNGLSIKALAEATDLGGSEVELEEVTVPVGSGATPPGASVESRDRATACVAIPCCATPTSRGSARYQAVPPRAHVLVVPHRLAPDPGGARTSAPLLPAPAARRARPANRPRAAPGPACERPTRRSTERSDVKHTPPSVRWRVGTVSLFLRRQNDPG